MKLIVDARDLRQAVETVLPVTLAEAVASSTASQVALVAGDDGGLQVLAANDRVAVRQRIPAQVEVTGEVRVSGQILGETVQSIGSKRTPLTITRLGEGDRGALRFQGPSFCFSLALATYYPFPESVSGGWEDEGGVEVRAGDLWAVLSETAHAAAKDDARPALAAVRLSVYGDGTLEAVATDSRRLAYRRAGEPQGKPTTIVLVPARRVAALRGILDGEGTVRVSVGNGRLHLAGPQWETTVTLIEGAFPDYFTLMQASTRPRFRVEQASLALAVRGVTALVDQRQPTIVMAWEDDHARFSGASVRQETEASTEVEVVVTEAGQVVVSADLLAEAVSGLPTGEVEVSWGGGLYPLILSRDEATEVVLPMTAK